MSVVRRRDETKNIYIYIIMKLSNKNTVFFVCIRIGGSYSTADEERSVLFESFIIIYIFFVSFLRNCRRRTLFLFESFIIIYIFFSFHFYVLRHSPADPTTSIICLKQVPLCPPFHFCLIHTFPGFPYYDIIDVHQC